MNLFGTGAVAWEDLSPRREGVLLVMIAHDMNAKVHCPNCLAEFSVPASLIGKRTRCTKCSKPFQLVTDPDTASVDPDPWDPKQPHASDSPSGTYDDPPWNWGPDPAHGQAPPAPAISERVDDTRSKESIPRPHVSLKREASQPRRQFAAMRIVAVVLECAAILVAALSVLAGIIIAVGVVGAQISELRWWDLLEVLARSAAELLIGAITATLLFFLAQLIRLGLQIEQNTFDTRTSVGEMERLCRTKLDHCDDSPQSDGASAASMNSQSLRWKD